MHRLQESEQGVVEKVPTRDEHSDSTTLILLELFRAVLLFWLGAAAERSRTSKGDDVATCPEVLQSWRSSVRPPGFELLLESPAPGVAVAEPFLLMRQFSLMEETLDCPMFSIEHRDM